MGNLPVTQVKRKILLKGSGIACPKKLFFSNFFVLYDQTLSLHRGLKNMGFSTLLGLWTLHHC